MATKYLYEVDDKLYKDVNGELAFVADSPITESIIVEHGNTTYNPTIMVSSDLIKVYAYDNDPTVSDIRFNYTVLYKGQLILQDYDFNVSQGVRSLTITSTVNANDVLRILLSSDGGETWSTTEQGLIIECSLDDIVEKGMTHVTLNNLTKLQLQSFINESSTLRMAIYMKQKSSNAKIKIDHIRLEYDV